MNPHLLMCPPDHFGIEYEINPWMDKDHDADRTLALQQWRDLYQLLEDAGARISCLEPIPSLPDLVFTANAAVIHENLAILSHFHHPQRQGEEPHFRQWFTENGFRIWKPENDADFEGAGDALFCGDTLFAGYRIRSDIQAHQEVAEKLGCRVVPVELIDRSFYHLDTCFCPLALGTAIYFPDAFDMYGRRTLKQWIEHLIPVSEPEARAFACNAVVLGRTVVTPTGCPKLHDQLRARGFTPKETPLGEFIKAGGAAKCLTLRLDGEEAAGWKQAGR